MQDPFHEGRKDRCEYILEAWINIDSLLNPDRYSYRSGHAGRRDPSIDGKVAQKRILPSENVTFLR